MPLSIRVFRFCALQLFSISTASHSKNRSILFFCVVTFTLKLSLLFSRLIVPNVSVPFSLESFNNYVNTILKFIDRKILALGFKKVSSFIVENPKLEIYKLSLHNLFRLEEHIQPDEISQKIKENCDSVNEQLSIYNNLLRDIEYGIINVDGEKIKITSSNFAKYISSRD